jgi:hypothetical protein
LKLLYLCGCNKITDSSIAEISKKCLKLEEFNLSENENITDLCLFEIANNCLNLKIIKS